eukprot:6066657-Ditylum_brightwellii.AAC.1
MIEALSLTASDLQNASPNFSSNTNVTNVATNLTAQKTKKLEHSMNATTVTKSLTSHSTEAPSQHCLSHPALQDGHDFV